MGYLQMKKQKSLINRSICFMFSFLIINLIALYVYGIESRFVESNAILFDGNVGEWDDDTGIILGKKSIIDGANNWKGMDDISGEIKFRHDDKNLYIAIKVSDNRLINSSKKSMDEDHVELWFYQPVKEKKALTKIGIFVNTQGKTPGSVVMFNSNNKGVAIKGAKIDSIIHEESYEAEVAIPWKSFPGGPYNRTNTQIGVLLIDCDQASHPQKEVVLGNIKNINLDPEKLPQLYMSDMNSVLEEFGANKNLDNEPNFDLYANVHGDQTLERILIWNNYLIVMGPAFTEGNLYFYYGLPVKSGNDVLKVEFSDATGDKRNEIMVRYKQANNSGKREVLAIYQFLNEDFSPIFTAEVYKEQNGKIISNTIEFTQTRKNGPAVITQKVDKIIGFTQDNFRELPADDAYPILLPWEGEAKRYILKGPQFFPEE